METRDKNMLCARIERHQECGAEYVEAVIMRREMVDGEVSLYPSKITENWPSFPTF
jgi:hypothetical protein